MVGEPKEYFPPFYISQLVVDEASAGDPAAARERLKVVQDLPLLDITPEVVDRASSILASGNALAGLLPTLHTSP